MFRQPGCLRRSAGPELNLGCLCFLALPGRLQLRLTTAWSTQQQQVSPAVKFVSGYMSILVCACFLASVLLFFAKQQWRTLCSTPPWRPRMTCPTCQSVHESWIATALFATYTFPAAVVFT
ncbi:hypothetical protein COO60DRAFT_576347 [Scenedesmus sp. NREL 46B-D3]|nr:hypothetical protein COO60DRAFT_576347 [Scenedesmus sp. NREL 46B-D3]